MIRRCAGWMLALLIGGWAGGCFGPVVRPAADFSRCPDGSQGQLYYRFSSSSTTVPGHSVNSLSWNVEDRTPPATSSGEAVHRFPEAGTYLTTLVATGDRGVSGTASKAVSVRTAAVIRIWQLFFGFPVRVAGEVENRSATTLATVTIKAKFYDADGLWLTDGTTGITDLEPGERALFTVTAQEDTSRIFSALVSVDAFTADWTTSPVPRDAASR